MSNLPFPERILHQHIAVLGKTGSGKSSALRDIAEHLLDKNKRIFVIHPKGAWWGLKSSADGKSAGYPVIAFGDFKEPRATDVPINAASGKHVAELIATGNRPCIIGFRGWMPSQLTQFWLDFAPAIFNMNEGEIYGFISEVQNFAPKGKILDPNSAKMIHWTNRIMAEGRGLGITFFLDSQRSQKVHNDTLDGCETLVAMRATHPAARQSIKDWIDGNGDPKVGKEVLDTLASLVRGEAWVWSPEAGFGPQRVQFPMFGTFDSFAPPQLQKKVSQAGWSDVNLEQVKEKLAAVIAEAKANDPKELKAEISRLKAENAKKVHASPTPAPVVDQKAIERAVKTATAPLFARLASMRKLAQRSMNELAHVSGPLQEMANLEAPEIPQVAAPVTPPAPVRVQTPTPRTVPAKTNGNADAVISAAHVRLLSRLVELTLATQQSTVRKEQLAAWSGYTPTGGGFTNYLGALRSAGMIDYPSPGFVSITDAGREVAQPENTPTTSDEMLQRAKTVLGGSESRILEFVHNAHGSPVSKAALAEATGFTPTGGGFTNYLGRMRTLGFIDYPAPGQVKCADWMYL